MVHKNKTRRRKNGGTKHRSSRKSSNKKWMSNKTEINEKIMREEDRLSILPDVDRHLVFAKERQ